MQLIGHEPLVKLIDTWTKRWHTLNGVEMPNLPWLNRERDPKASGDWNVRVDLSFKTYSSTLEGSGGHTFHHHCGADINWWGEPQHPRRALGSLFCVGQNFHENCYHGIGKPKCNGGHWITKFKVGVVAVVDSRVKAIIRRV